LLHKRKNKRIERKKERTEERRLKREAERIRQENEKAIMEMKIKADQEAEERRQQHELDMEKLKANTSLEHSRHESTRLEIANKPKPKIPFFDEKVDEMDSYLERFE